MKPDGSLRVARASRNNSLQLKLIKPIPHFRNITFHDIKGFFTRASQSSQELNEAAYSLPPPDAPNIVILRVYLLRPLKAQIKNACQSSSALRVILVRDKVVRSMHVSNAKVHNITVSKSHRQRIKRQC